MRMAEKKGKALAMKLLDDLIDDESSPSSSAQSDDVIEISIKVDEDSPWGAGTSTRAVEPTVKTKEPAPKVVESTVKLSATKITEIPDEKSKSKVTQFNSRGLSSATGAALVSSENLKIAQMRIVDLEQEIEKLRLLNEQLAAAGEMFRQKSDELQAQNQNVKSRLERATEAKDHELEILRQVVDKKEKEQQILKVKVDELEMRLSSNIQKIRVRERELENRLELIKVENAAVVRTKDNMLLDLKRQLDQASIELDNFRHKGQELNKQLADKQEVLRRTVKALRIALSMLESDDEPESKKAK